jgi:Tfp pilus assembly protein PilN
VQLEQFSSCSCGLQFSCSASLVVLVVLVILVILVVLVSNTNSTSNTRRELLLKSFLQLLPELRDSYPTALQKKMQDRLTSVINSGRGGAYYFGS